LLKSDTKEVQAVAECLRAVEAITIVTSQNCVYSTKDGYCQHDDITEAIPPFEPCEEAISRQAVLDLVNADWKYENLESDIANLPPVTPQQKIGYWTRELIRNDKVPQLVKASSYKTKTGRHFPQIVEVLDAILP